MKSKTIRVSYKVCVIPYDGAWYCGTKCPHYIPDGDGPCIGDKRNDCRLFGGSSNCFGAKGQFVLSECERMLKRMKVRPPRRLGHKWQYKTDSSHDMTEEEGKVMAPVGTARAYIYRKCRNCGAEQYEHTAGKFCDPELLKVCLNTTRDED